MLDMFYVLFIDYINCICQIAKVVWWSETINCGRKDKKTEETFNGANTKTIKPDFVDDIIFTKGILQNVWEINVLCSFIVSFPMCV